MQSEPLRPVPGGCLRGASLPGLWSCVPPQGRGEVLCCPPLPAGPPASMPWLRALGTAVRRARRVLVFSAWTPPSVPRRWSPILTHSSPAASPPSVPAGRADLPCCSHPQRSQQSARVMLTVVSFRVNLSRLRDERSRCLDEDALTPQSENRHGPTLRTPAPHSAQPREGGVSPRQSVSARHRD